MRILARNAMGIPVKIVNFGGYVLKATADKVCSLFWKYKDSKHARAVVRTKTI